MDYKKQFLKYRNKYIKSQIGGYHTTYIDEQYAHKYNSLIMIDYNLFLHTVLNSNVDKYIKVSEHLYNQLQFYVHYPSINNKVVYRSNSVCNGDVYFNASRKNYIVTRHSIPTGNPIYYYELKLIMKGNNCFSYLPDSYLTQQTYLQHDYEKYKKESHLLKKQRELNEREEDLSDRESELEEKEKRLRKKRKSKKSKKSKKKKRKSKKKKRKSKKKK
jgi:hypothetical protein